MINKEYKIYLSEEELRIITSISSKYFDSIKEKAGRILHKIEIKNNTKIAKKLNSEGKTKRQLYNERRRNCSQYAKFITLCEEIMNLKHLDLQATKKNRKGQIKVIQGRYKKADLRNYLNIKDTGQFARTILNNPYVVDFLRNHNIIDAGQSLDFTCSSGE